MVNKMAKITFKKSNNIHGFSGLSNGKVRIRVTHAKDFTNNKWRFIWIYIAILYEGGMISIFAEL